REEHPLEEQEEEQQVDRDERAEHRGLDEQQGGHVPADLLLHLPGGEDPERHQERREQHHEDAHAVHADRVVQADRGGPVRMLHELEAGGAGVERSQHPEREHEREDGYHERERPRDVVLQVRDEQQRRDPDQRREDDEREPGHLAPPAYVDQERDGSEEE